MSIFDLSCGIDGVTRIAIERAKINGSVDFGYTCFKGKTKFTKENLRNSMWLAERLKRQSF